MGRWRAVLPLATFGAYLDQRKPLRGSGVIRLPATARAQLCPTADAQVNVAGVQDRSAGRAPAAGAARYRRAVLLDQPRGEGFCATRGVDVTFGG